MTQKSIFQPLYQKLADTICEEIVALELNNGDFYCKLKDLCVRNNVSLITVRKAVSLLETDGILLCKSSSGIYIKNTEFLNTRSSLRNEILILHHHARKAPNPFFELRLSAMLQNFTTEGFMPRVFYLEELLEENIDLLASRVKGLVGGNTMSDALAAKLRNFPGVSLLLLNPPDTLAPKRNLCLVRYDFEKAVQMSIEYIQKHHCGPVCRVLTDKGYSVPRLEEQLSAGFQSIDGVPGIDGCGDLPDRLAALPGKPFFWITDDFLALGIYREFLKSGIDLVADGRLLVNASPGMKFTEGLHIPVIGFCPFHTGSAAAVFFSDFIKTPLLHRSLKPCLIEPAGNTAAQA